MTKMRMTQKKVAMRQMIPAFSPYTPKTQMTVAKTVFMNPQSISANGSLWTKVVQRNVAT